MGKPMCSGLRARECPQGENKLPGCSKSYNDKKSQPFNGWLLLCP